MKKQIGKELKIERVKAELTLEDMACSLGVSPSSLSCAERGLGGFKLMKRMAEHLGLELVIKQDYTLKKKSE
jgi:transcriptional regulator with XRE-family HTH domain